MSNNRLLIGATLYATLLYAVSLQMDGLTKTLLSQTSLAGMSREGSNLKPRKFDRTAIKLLSTNPNQDYIQQSGIDIDGLAFDKDAAKGSWASKIKDEIPAALKEMVPEPIVTFAPQPITHTIHISAITHDGAFIQGRYMPIGDTFLKGFQWRLRETSPDVGYLEIHNPASGQTERLRVGENSIQEIPAKQRARNNQGA